ncbi:hypothetical protein [Allokutzneria sp. NRRL B-24872]|uniref:hypothetical protein n=1 Tax=Allokutzneria sp. NRRL B-24872 TaxID=1137961 RepID=UPI001177407A|nr:hypothetical protein [Allokutzneria sp. NRRL B-24872]
MDVEQWCEEMHMRIWLLDDLFGDEADLDFTPESLTSLEAALLDEFEELPDPGAVPIATYSADYLGEVLLQVTGGGWKVVAGVPIIKPDTVLGLRWLAPLDLVRIAVQRRTGEEFRRVHDAWTATAGEHKRAHPGWFPDKEPTPGLDLELPGPSAALDAWLTRHEREFPAWCARFGGEGVWDFSADSIDALTNAVFRETPTWAHFPEHPEFIDGAAWYWGEVLRRAVAGSWQHTPGERDGMTPTLGYFWVYRPDGGASFTPELNLANMVEREDRQRLPTILDTWTS